MATKLTKRTVDAAQPGTADLFLWDGDVKGFGLKVTASGRKIYVLQYRTQGGQSRRYTIGKHGSPWTPDLARTEAERLLRRIAEGKDPQAEKKAARTPDATLTVAAVFETFMQRHVSQTRVEKEYRGAFKNEVLPHWGDWPIGRVERRDVIAMLDRIVDRGVPMRANRVFAYVRKFFNWCISRDLIATSPCIGVRPPTPERDRDRVLSDEEVRVLGVAAGTLGWPFGPFVTMLLLTAQRLNEVAGMRWSELDLDAALWTLPAGRAKNGQAHHVPLSPPAVPLIRSLPRLAGSDIVFTTTGTTPISGFGRAKRRLDAAMLTILRREAKERGEDPDAIKGLPDWRFHDIRRTATTGMAQLGVPPHVADRILNHVQGTIRGVAAVYNRHTYLAERRQALYVWAERLHTLKVLGHGGEQGAQCSQSVRGESV